MKSSRFDLAAACSAAALTAFASASAFAQVTPRPDPLNSVPAIAAPMIGVAAPAMAQQAGHAGHAGHGAGVAEGKSTDNFVEGEVRKVDKAAGKITIKHGPIPNLEMPAMTMVFRAKDPSALDKLKVGDTLKFKAEKIDGNFTITDLKPAS